MSNSSKGFWDDELPVAPEQTGQNQSVAAEEDKAEPIASEAPPADHESRRKAPQEKTFDCKPEPYQPEQVVLKKKNKKDIIIIIAVIAALLTAIALGTVYLYNAGNRQIYSYIDSGSYAIAYKEIRELYDNGENVDSLAMKYIEACMEDAEYKRAVHAVAVLSDRGFSENADYLKEMVPRLLGGGKADLAEELGVVLEQHNIK